MKMRAPLYLMTVQMVPSLKLLCMIGESPMINYSILFRLKTKLSKDEGISWPLKIDYIENDGQPDLLLN